MTFAFPGFKLFMIVGAVEILLGVLLLASGRAGDAVGSLDFAAANLGGDVGREARRLLADARLRSGAFEAAAREAAGLLVDDLRDQRARLILAEARLGGGGDGEGRLLGEDGDAEAEEEEDEGHDENQRCQGQLEAALPPVQCGEEAASGKGSVDRLGEGAVFDLALAAVGETDAATN